MSTMLRRRLFPILILLMFSAAACGDDSNPGNNDPNDVADAGTDTEGGEDIFDDTDSTDPDAGDLDGEDPDGDDPDADDPDTTDPTDETIVTCDNPTTAPPQGRSCRTTQGSSNLVLMQGTVLAGDTVYENGQILIDRSDANATLACVGCDCGDDAAAASATVIECADSVISPGLVNAHEHLGWGARSPKSHGDERYDHRHDWRRGLRGHSEISSGGGDYSKDAVLYGELRHLLSGVTSMAGSGGAAGLVRNLDDDNYTEGINVTVKYDTFPLGDSNGDLRADGCSYGGIADASVLNNDIYLPHISEGIDPEAENEFKCLSSSESGGQDLVELNTSMIHGVGLSAADIAEASAGGTKLVWSPRTNIDLYGNTADVITYDRLGVTIALGTDWVLSGSMNMSRELQCVDYLNQNQYDNYFSDYQIWRMATENGATALGVGDKLGKIAEGYVADIAIYNASDSDNYRAVIDAQPDDVLLVMRGGTALIGESNLMQALVPADEIDDCSGVTMCDSARLTCFKSDTFHNDTSYSWADITSTSPYGPFFCGTPDDEPSCVPMRPDEYSGMSTEDDSDGDGIVDADDSCPSVFNPPRPLDGDVQADYDSDGIGDVCDECPLNEGETCEAFDPNDRDNDGIENDADVCPDIANPDQTDSDSDGIGDECDPCPDFANPGFSACPATTYDIWDGTQAQGANVLLEDVIVTASDDTQAIMIQHISGDAFDANGAPHSGIYVYMPDANTIPARGDIIDIEAVVGSFGDSLQLVDPSSITVTSSGNTLPAAVAVDSADIAAGGSEAETYLGVLVQVENVTVTAGVNEHGEFELTGGLLVDDVFYAPSPAPEVGDAYSAVVGPLQSSFGTNKILIRDDNDLIQGPPELLEMTPSQAFMDAEGNIPLDLTVRLTHAGTTDTTVSLAYSNGNVTGPSDVTIPAGQTSADVPLTPMGDAGDTTDVTATLGSVSVTTGVTLYDDQTQRIVTSLTPTDVTLGFDDQTTLTVSINAPAGTGGEVVNLVTNGDVSAPATVTVPAGDFDVDFQITAGTTEETASVTALIGATSDSVTTSVTITAAPQTPCLIIGEYVEGGSFNKGIELYNCGSTPLELADFGVCQINNADTECGQFQTMLSDQTLAPNAVFTMCHSDAGFAGDCDMLDSNTINHNGNDRYVVFKDDDGSSSFESANDTVTDAFGETATEPDSGVWKDQTYRRCNFEPFYGDVPFDLGTFYTSHPKDDVDDFGTAPTEGC